MPTPKHWEAMAPIWGVGAEVTYDSKFNNPYSMGAGSYTTVETFVYAVPEADANGFQRVHRVTDADGFRHHVGALATPRSGRFVWLSSERWEWAKDRDPRPSSSTVTNAANPTAKYEAWPAMGEAPTYDGKEYINYSTADGWHPTFKHCVDHIQYAAER